MNAYYKVAQNYFRHMEGWHLYPGPREPWVWAWLMLSFAWMTSFVWLFQKVPALLSWQMAVVIVLEVALMLVADGISNRKRAALFGVPSGQKIGASDLDAFRCKLLCDYLATSPDKFLQIADEISGLIDTRRKFRRSSEIEWSLIFKKFYDPEAKQRVLAVFLAGVTVLTALTLKIGDLPPIFEVLDSQDVLRLLGGVWSITVIIFILFIGIQVLSAVLWNALIIWVAKSLKTAFSDDAALRYLVRDLLVLYRPSNLEAVVQITEKTLPQQSVADSTTCEREDQLAY